MFDEGSTTELELDPYLGLSPDQFDRELELDDPILRSLLVEATEPPPDLSDRVAARTRDQLLRRKIGSQVLGLMTLGVPTAKSMLLEPEPEPDDSAEPGAD